MCIGEYEPTTLVLAPLIILLSTDPTQHLIHTFTKPVPVRLTEGHPLYDRLTTPPFAPPIASPSHFLTKNHYNSPIRGLFKISNQTSFRTTQSGSIQNIQPNILPYNLSRVHSEFPQKISNSQPELTPIYLPREISSQYLSYTTFTKKHQ